jgi:hypothetical protein
MSILPVANNLANNAVPINNVYYGESNLSVAKVRTLSKDCYRQSFLSTEIGAQSITLTVPRNLLVGNIIVQFKLNIPQADFSAGYYLSPGWGFKLIRRITWIYSGSESLECSGRSNFMMAMNECENDRKKQALLEIAGPFIKRSRGGDIDPVGPAYSASVPIYCPHSSVNASAQIPFDCGLLNSNIQIRLDLVSPEELWSSMTVEGNNQLDPLSNAMRRLDSGLFLVSQHYMLDSVDEMRMAVGANGPSRYNYFFRYPQQFTSDVIKIAKNTSLVSEVQSVTLNGFRNGSLQEIYIYLERDENNFAQNEQGANQVGPAYMKTQKLTEIKLDYGGQCVYSSEDENSALLLDLCNHHTDSTYPQLGVLRNTTNTSENAETSTQQGRGVCYRIVLSQFSSVFRDYIQSGCNISADTMQLSFRIIDNFNQVRAGQTQNYILRANYIFQSALTVQKGSGHFSFVNPLPGISPQQLQLTA